MLYSDCGACALYTDDMSTECALYTDGTCLLNVQLYTGDASTECELYTDDTSTEYTPTGRRPVPTAAILAGVSRLYIHVLQQA